MKSTFNILFYLKYGSPAKDGKLPLMCRITIDSDKTTFSCKKTLPPEIWDSKKGVAKGDSDEAKLANYTMDEIKKRLYRYYSEIMRTEGYVTPIHLKEFLLGVSSRDEMLLYRFNKHNHDYKKMVGAGRSLKTYQRYEIVYNHLKEFIIEEYRMTDIRMRDFSAKGVNLFDNWLRTERGCKTNTVWAYMTTLKHIFALASADGILKVNPFLGYKSRFEQVDRGYLSEEELAIVMKAEPVSPMEGLVRDLFVFSAFTGLSYTDVEKLEWGNLHKFFDGNTWIITRRRKTNTDTRVRVLDVPLKIIEQRGDRQSKIVFHIPSNNCCNVHLTELGQRCGINFRLTFHIARHTFATLLLSKGVPIESVSSILGHTNIKTTQIYAKITSKKLSEDMEALSQKIKNLESEYPNK